CLDTPSQFSKQIVTTMNIAYAIDPSSVRNATRNRDRGRRFPKRLEERTRPPHGFGSQQLARMDAYAVTKGETEIGRPRRVERERFKESPIRLPKEQRAFMPALMRPGKSQFDEAPPGSPSPSSRATRERVRRHRAARVCPRSLQKARTRFGLTDQGSDRY